MFVRDYNCVSKINIASRHVLQFSVIKSEIRWIDIVMRGLFIKNLKLFICCSVSLASTSVLSLVSRVHVKQREQ